VLVGALNETVALPEPLVATTLVGAPGAPSQLPALLSNCWSTALTIIPVEVAVTVCAGPTIP
jgi:hypothetical protein